jgi:heme/copper-type cytochrome/quinol oxidase subunit 2
MNQPKPYSVWDEKPRWCQPWTILATGIAIIGITWLLFRIWWLILLISLPIALWWFVFLILYPQAARRIHGEGAIDP